MGAVTLAEVAGLFDELSRWLTRTVVVREF
jgi:hypothetical protein